VRRTDEERQGLETLVSQGRAAARKITRAWILLKADVAPGPGWSDEQICATFAVGLATIYRVRQTFVEEGLDAVLTRRPKSRHRPRKLDGEQEAHLVALACSKPPPGRRRWTIRLLADQPSLTTLATAFSMFAWDPLAAASSLSGRRAASVTP